MEEKDKAMTKSKTPGNFNTQTADSARELAKKNLEDIKHAQEQFLMAMSSAQSALWQSTGMPNNESADQLNSKAFNIMKDNIESGYDFAKKLVDATDISEAVELQNDFIRNQIEQYTLQAQELSDAMIHNKDDD